MTLVRHLTAALLLACGGIAAAEAPADRDDVRLRALAEELRCLVCQNQSLADSGSGLAQDMRGMMRALMAEGATDTEITAQLVARYGDFVRYRPPLKASTAMLWFAPGLALVVAVGWLARRIGRNAAHDQELELNQEERLRLQALTRTGASGAET